MMYTVHGSLLCFPGAPCPHGVAASIYDFQLCYQPKLTQHICYLEQKFGYTASAMVL